MNESDAQIIARRSAIIQTFYVALLVFCLEAIHKMYVCRPAPVAI